MNVLDILKNAYAFGIGGAVGAASKTVLAAEQVLAESAQFRLDFNKAMSGRSDPDAVAAKASFEATEQAVSDLLASINELKRALRIR